MVLNPAIQVWSDLRADWCFCCEALQMDHASLLKQFEHLDPHNQNTFEAKDLELLISTVTSEAADRGPPGESSVRAAA